MNIPLLMDDASERITRRADQIFANQIEVGCRGVDRIFSVILPLQWLAAIVLALTVTPRSWAGETSYVHSHVWAALLLGGSIVSLPIALAWLCPGWALTRQAMAIGQMLMGSLLIHISGGRIETHFHVFGSLAFLALYKDWRVLATATLIAGLDHFLRGAYWPRSIFGVLVASPWRWIEHTAWVLFEVVVLVFGSLQRLQAIRKVAHHEAEIEATRDQFERAVARRTVELEGANEALRCEVVERRNAETKAIEAQKLSEAATRAKSEFLANMSHEIRTPMNGILGMTELVLESKLSLAQREYLGLVKTSADSLLSIINDILDTSKIEAGKLDLDETDFELREVLSDALKPIASRANAKGLELCCDVDQDVPDVLFGDAGRLRQVLLNLVGNAVKFTLQGEVILRVGRDIEPGAPAHSLRFSVSDTGIGIPKDKQRIIFEAFTQADGSTTRKFGGTGLGLAISRNLVKLMRGCLCVESDTGCGSTFHFTLTLPPASDHPLANLRNATTELKGIRVLIVDDNATSLSILQKIAIGWGMEPTVCNSGRLGLEEMSRAVVEGKPFPLVLLDAMMPGEDGCELIRRIDAEDSLVGATILMLSSADPVSRVSPSIDDGMRGGLFKPIRQSDLLDAIRKSLPHATGPESIAAKPKPLDAATAPPPLRILLAEDNLVNQILAVRLLEKQGHSVVVAADGRQALDLLMASHFDLSIIDVQMPVMDGLEATAALRAHESQTGGHLPVIALTANAMEGDRELCLRAGFDEYVTKPIRWSLLAAAIEALIPSSSNIDTSERQETPSVAIFDLDSALERVGGDIEILKEVAEMFLEDYPKIFSQLVDAVQLKDAKAIEFTAHKLRGAAATFASRTMEEVAIRLERLGALGNLSEVAEAFFPLPGILELLRVDLNHLVNGELPICSVVTSNITHCTPQEYCGFHIPGSN